MEFNGSTGCEAPPDDRETSDMEERERQEPPVPGVVSKSTPGGLDCRLDVPRGEHDTSRMPGTSGCWDDGVRRPGHGAVRVDAMRTVRCRHRSEQRYGDQGNDVFQGQCRGKGNHIAGLDAFVAKSLCVRVDPAVELCIRDRAIGGGHCAGIGMCPCMDPHPLVRQGVSHGDHYSIAS